LCYRFNSTHRFESMLTREKAREIIESKINQPDPYWKDKPKLVVIDGHTIEKQWGWVFFYDSSDFLKSGKLEDALSGNAPYIVNRNTGEIVETGTAYDIDHYVEDYESKL